MNGIILCMCVITYTVLTVSVQEMSELQVIGRAQGHTEEGEFPSPDLHVGRQRMRTDSLDSLGECDSASEGDELPGYEVVYPFNYSQSYINRLLLL